MPDDIVAPVAATTEQAAPSSTPNVEAGQATPEATVGESTFTNIDPTTLSPELQEIYKSMQADFTKKTQGISQTQKDAEAFKQRAEMLDQLMADQEFVKLVQEYSNPKPQAPIIPEFTNAAEALKAMETDPSAMDRYIQSQIEAKVAPLAQSEQQRQQQQISERAGSIEKTFLETHEDLVKNPELYKLVNEQVRMMNIPEGSDDKTALKYLESAYKAAKFDSVKEESIQEGITKAKNRDNAAQPESGSATVHGSHRSKNIEEAFNRAAEKLGWNG